MRRALALLPLCFACSEVPVRGEVVLVVDTDALVPRHLDALRIAVHRGDTHELVAERQLTLATPELWPVSFGLAASDLTGEPSFRVLLTGHQSRAVVDPFAGEVDDAFTLPAVCPAGLPPDEPTPELRAPLAEGEALPQHAISRVVDVRVTRGTVTSARVTLRASCLGAAPARPDDPQTCVDGVLGSAGDGVEPVTVDAPTPTRAGTSPLVAETPCEADDTAGLAGRACVPGGLGYLGSLSDFGQGSCAACRHAPTVPVRVEPFLMDRYEVTVGRLYDALHDPVEPFVPFFGGIREPLVPADKQGEHYDLCSWRGAWDPGGAGPPPTGDERRRAVTCVSWRFAEQLCAWAGGTLPSEAQWWFAASGRGGETVYPWGDGPKPGCGDAAYAPGGCDLVEPPPVDGWPLDHTPEGIANLFGGVAELTADLPGAMTRPGCRASTTVGLGNRVYTGPVAGDGPCSCAGAVNVPPVDDAEALLSARVVRGAAWVPGAGTRGRQVQFSPFQQIPAVSAYLGFRCVYPAGGAP